MVPGRFSAGTEVVLSPLAPERPGWRGTVVHVSAPQDADPTDSSWLYEVRAVDGTAVRVSEDLLDDLNEAASAQVEKALRQTCSGMGYDRLLERVDAPMFAETTEIGGGPYWLNEVTVRTAQQPTGSLEVSVIVIEGPSHLPLGSTHHAVGLLHADGRLET